MQRKGQNYLTAGYERKLLAGMLFVMLVFLPTLGFAMYSLSSVSRMESQLNSVYTKTLLLAEDLRTAKVRQDAILPVFVLSGDQSLINELHKSDADFAKALSALETMPLAPAAEITLMDIRTMQQKLLAVEQPGIDMKLRGASTDEVHDYFRQNGVQFIRPILSNLDQFVQTTSDTYDRKKASSNRQIRTVFRLLAVAGSFSVILSAAMTILLIRVIRRKTEYDLLNERLAHREKEVSTARKEALETVAHDLRNPLGAVMMATDMLGSEPDLSARNRSRLKIITSSVESMNRLVGNLLDHTKIEAGSLSLAKDTCEMGPILTRLISRFGILAEAKGVRILDETSVRNLPMLMDEARVEQVFSNLLGNAVKFTPRGGTIRISDATEDGMLVVSIEDTGPGMTAEQTDHIFERYWQAGETASAGTGLGLAIAKAIIDAHEGRITVRSEPGVGSTFFVALPIEAKAQSRVA